MLLFLTALITISTLFGNKSPLFLTLITIFTLFGDKSPLFLALITIFTLSGDKYSLNINQNVDRPKNSCILYKIVLPSESSASSS